MSGRAVYGTVYGSQKCTPGFIVKYDHNAGVWKVIGVRLGFTAEEHTRTELIRQKKCKKCKNKPFLDIQSQVNFLCIALFTIHIVSKQLCREP